MAARRSLGGKTGPPTPQSPVSIMGMFACVCVRALQLVSIVDVVIKSHKPIGDHSGIGDGPRFKVGYKKGFVVSP